MQKVIFNSALFKFNFQRRCKKKHAGGDFTFSFILVLLLAIFLAACKEDVAKKKDRNVLSGFSPTEGGEGDLVILRGGNFSEDIEPIEVKFGDVFGEVESVTENEILVRLPSYIQDCGEVTIEVISDTRTIYSKTAFQLSCPSIESFTPTSGDPGDIITINGANFTSDENRITVTIGDGETEVVAATPSVLNVKLLSGYSGYYPIKIKISNKEGTSTDQFRINGPMITDFTPSTANECGKITITGTDFSPVASENKVYFAYKQATVESATTTQLIVTPPYDLEEIAGTPVTIFVSVNEKAGYSANKITLSASAWQKKASLGNLGRWRGIGFSIGEKGYAGTGTVIDNGLAELRKDFWEYNGATNGWTRKADIPGVARLDAVGFAIGGKGYVGLGGDHSNVFFNDFWEYNPTTNTWLQMPDFPGSNRAGAIAFSVGGKGYVGVGWAFESTSDIWEFDPQDKTWTKVTDYPGAGTSGMVCFAIDTKAYIGTGFFTNDFWEYTPSTNQWHQLNNFPEPFLNNGVSFAFHGFGIAGTGAGLNGDRSNHVWKYDPVNDTWRRLPNFGGDVRNFAVGFPLQDGFMIGTGSTTFNIDETNDFYKYVCE